MFDAEPSGPHTKRQGFPAETDLAVGSGVLHLLRSRRPTAVSRLVSEFIGYAIKRGSIRLLAHVSEEISEAVAPTVTN